MKWLIGVDEAGRGPLAGPVTVGAVCVAHDFDWRRLPNVADSKQLSAVKRDTIYTEARRLRNDGLIAYSVAMTSAPVIDQIGIARAVERALARSISRIAKEPDTTLVLLDGLLRAPERFIHQQTINGGDGKEKVIGLASILAKVTRDRYMARIAEKPQFAPYEFHVHKGYGTKRHRECIQKYGLSELHRTSYCKNIFVL